MDAADEIKKRIDITEFISQYLQLKKVGINYSALCPFHSEKTPSFMVSPQRQSFRCFGCGEAGDVISFYQKIEGLSFPEAIKLLGERVGVDVHFKSKEASDRERTIRDKIFRINLLAAKYFKMMLGKKAGRSALEYLRNRGFSAKTLEKFKVGFAPADQKLKSLFYKMGISESDLKLAGHPDRFRHRIIFPIFDILGNVIGFSGRILEEDLPQGLPTHPKYLNTPETAVFHKSRVLYGINFAKESIRKNQRVVVVEGQMDVMASSEAGIEEVVASSGTALTSEHLKVIRRYSQNVIFAFDEDEAGQKAARSATELALFQGLEVKLVTLEKYKDIGELVEKERGKLGDVLSAALPPVEWLVSRAGKNLTASEKKKLVREALFFIVAMPDEIEKAHYISYLAKKLAIPEVAIERELEKVALPAKENEQAKPPEDDLQLCFLAFLINFPKLSKNFSLPEQIDFTDQTYQQIYTQVKKCYDNSSVREADLKEIKRSLGRDISQMIDVAALQWDKKIADGQDEAVEEFLSIKSRLQSRRNEKIKQGFARLIADAESSGDIKKVRQLMAKLQEKLK